MRAVVSVALSDPHSPPSPCVLAVVFRVHYQELLMRTEEIERLKAEVERLQQSHQQGYQGQGQAEGQLS